MKNYIKKLLMLSLLSISTILPMEEQELGSGKQAEITGEIVFENLGLINEMWAQILEHVYFDPSILNEAKDIYEGIDAIQKHINKCHKTISLVCKTFRALSISKEQWSEFKEKIREFYILQLNHKFLEQREGEEGLYPKNEEWHNDHTINNDIAQFIANGILLDNQLLINLINYNLNLMNLLLFYGANVNSKNKDGISLVHNIIGYPDRCNKKDILLFLLNRKADPNAQDRWGNTPLLSYLNRKTEQIITELLLKAGTDVNIQNNRGETALFIATDHENSSEIIRLLLQYGAKPNISDDCFGQTPLYKAAYRHHKHNNNTNAIILLLQYGANPNLKTKQGRTAFDAARLMGSSQDFGRLVIFFSKYSQKNLLTLS